jgi:DNA polymerase III epsilon subunit-like protein
MIVVDVETTGLDPKRLSILSIGAVDFANPGRYFYTEMSPWEDATDITDEALKVNGLDLRALRESRITQAGAYSLFLGWAEGVKGPKILAGHNAWFDYLCLKEMAKREVYEWPFGHRVVDLFSIAFEAHYALTGEEKDLGSRDIFKFVGIPDEPKPHNALNGARWEAEALHRLLTGYSKLPEFKDYPIPEVLDASLLEISN